MLRKTVAVTAVLAFLASCVLAGETKREDVAKAAKKGAEFLVKKQNEDGGFGEMRGKPASSVGYTGMVVAALVESGNAPGGKDGEVVKKAVDFMLKNVQPDGGIYIPVMGIHSYETSVAIMALAAVDKEKHKDVIKKAVAYITGCQDTGAKNKSDAGGFGYAGDGSNANLSSTHYALAALKDAGVPEDSDVWKRAVAFVSVCQNNSETNSQEWAAVVNDGGFIYTPKGGRDQDAVEANGKKGWRSYGSMTYDGYLSYVYAKLGKDDPRVKAALRWVAENYSVDENPGQGMAGYYYYTFAFAAAMTARGEATVKDKAGKEHNWASELGAKLVSLQTEDGSWVNKADRWHEGSPLICTAFSLRALAKTLAALPN